MSTKLRVVFDTQVFLRSVINDKSISARVLTKHWRGHYTLYISDATEAEIKDVLTRSKIRQKFPQITDALVETVFAVIRDEAERVHPEAIEPVCRDPKDDMFLACAKAAQADYLVSEDQDLLVLDAYAGTKIVNVSAFLSALEQATPPD